MVRDTGNSPTERRQQPHVHHTEETNVQFYKNAALIVSALAAILFAGVSFMPIDVQHSGDLIICQHHL